MSRIDGRRPKASGQTITAGYAPVAGWMNAASQVPSGVLISTFSSTTGSPAADALPAAIASPAATDIVTKSRRERSLDDAGSLPSSGLCARSSGLSAITPPSKYRRQGDADDM